MFHKTIGLFTFLTCCTIIHHAEAGGFYLQEQSAAAMGAAYAGAGAAARDANLAVIRSERGDSEVLVGTVGLAYKF